MQRAKHSKFKNTGLLFELLTRQVTADILAGREESPAKNLLFKYFSQNKNLGREWQLYNFLVNENAKDENQAEKYIGIVLKQREKLSNKDLTAEKYELIKEIKSLYPLDDLLKSNVKNYKIFASIYKLFEDHVNNKIKFDVKEVVQSRTCILENLCGVKKVKKESDDELLGYYKQQNEEIRLLSYKLLVESLNEKYKDLNAEQKLLLKEYINNISNTNSLHNFIINSVDSVKNQLNELSTKIEDNIIKIKINETIKQLENIKPNKTIKDNQVMVLLLSYELIKEIKKQL